jgi:hypothetical protein
MPHLSAAQINAIVQLIQPVCGTENERRALLDLIFAGASSKPDIDTSGAPLEFTRRLIFRVRDYGEVEPGKPALWALLEAIHPQVGIDKQTQIDALRPAIFAAAVPAADYIVATEGGKLIFISYSTLDAEFTDRLRADLSAAGLNLWIDRIGLKVGAPDWEEAIRDALKRADGVLFIASPDARKSRFVRDELAIAEDNNKPIFPVWVAGDRWTDAAPLGRGYAQYVDLRDERYQSGLARLIAALGGSSSAGTASADEPAPAVVPIVREEPPPPSDFVPRNPYKGLKAFRADDRTDFFGRDAFIDDLIASLRANPRFLAVIGASGSGKSSVVMAGLLPRLHDDALPGSEKWVYLDPFVPGTRPVEALSIALARHLPHKAQAAIDEDLLHPSARGLHRLAKQISQTRLVLYIDQFEELFTQTADDAERRQFIDLLTTAAHEPDSAVTILLTLRADFYDRPLGYADLGTLIEAHGKAILPLTLADLYDVILKPAALDDVRLAFEPGLAEEMVFSVKGETGALPLLQFTLDQLFQRREGLRLTRATYDALGGVRGALAKHAEATYQALDAEGQLLARGLFLRLIEPGATEQDITRRRARLSELTLNDDEQTKRLRAVADTFVQARLLTMDKNTIEVSHEALLSQWRTLRNWLEVERNYLVWRREFERDVAKWRTQKGGSFLYDAERLKDARKWQRIHPYDFVAEEVSFIAKSQRKVQLRRGTLVALVLGYVLLSLPPLLALGISTYVRWSVASPMVMFASGDADLGYPVSTVSVPAFALEKYEVSIGQYRACIEWGGCTFPDGATAVEDLNRLDQTLPVTRVTAYQAVAYCRWIGRRLPSSLEWERAARGTDGRPWPWGMTEPQIDFVNVSFLPHIATELVPVNDSRYLAGSSREGSIMHLVGNVWEWTATPIDPYSNGFCDYQNSCARTWDGSGVVETLMLRGYGYESVVPPEIDLDGESVPSILLGVPTQAGFNLIPDVGFRCALSS